MLKQAYPATRKSGQVDDYHGVAVRDPYRWLEQASSERTAWITAQNDVTRAYLSGLSFRAGLRQRFEELVNYPRYYELTRRGPYLLYKKNSGLQPQLVLYAQNGLNGAPEVLVDPNALSADGTIRLTRAVPSWDGRYVAYGLSQGGSDWEEYFVKAVATKQDLPDRLQWVKVSTIAWHGDGFYYSRYPASSEKRALTARNECHQVWYHRVGTPQSDDTLVYQDRTHLLRLYFLVTTEDQRYAVLDISDRGAGHAGNAVYVCDLRSGKQDFHAVVGALDDEFRFVDNDDDRLLFLTNRNAPNWRLVSIDPMNPREGAWVDVIPEGTTRLEVVSVAGSKLFAVYCQHAAHHVTIFGRGGDLENEMTAPGAGEITVFRGQRRDTDVLWSYSSFTTPATVYRYDFATHLSSPLWQPKLRFAVDDYETEQVFYPAGDGTDIPMFIVHRKGVVLDGQHPCLLSGYGGFGFTAGPCFDPLLIALLERDVIYAHAILRGGGEYGEDWHRAGWRERKQRVIDDCIAAAEWLQVHRYTNRDRLALMGVSHGGLVVAAALTQRPDVCRAVVPIGGVMDMLRFQHFTIGWSWIAEFGSSGDAAMLPILLSYSPLHNLKKGVSYPATLVVASAHDDRVVPAHSFKFVAGLQECGAGPGPYLIRVETRSGHSAVSLRKALEERADLYAFLLANVGQPITQPAVGMRESI